MTLPLLTKKEFVLFSNEFQLAYLDRHGRLVFFRISGDGFSVSVYELSSFQINVLKSFPEGDLIEISLIVRRSERIKYMSLMYRN